MNKKYNMKIEYIKLYSDDKKDIDDIFLEKTDLMNSISKFLHCGSEHEYKGKQKDLLSYYRKH